ncbi:hypothetical protein P7C73_g3237, partial [Tremellales sp. Uapishka_1]
MSVGASEFSGLPLSYLEAYPFPANQAYAGLLAEHPRVFGRPGREVWPTIWEGLQGVINLAYSGTPTYRADDLQLFRTYGDGILMESYHTWRFTPINARNGEVIGLFNQSLETTPAVLAERRLGTARELSDNLSVARTTREYYDAVISSLEMNRRDAPFAIIYSIDEVSSDPSSNTVEVNLQGYTGVPADHPSTPQQVIINYSNRTRTGMGVHADRLSSPTLSAISAISSGSGRVNHSSERQTWPVQKALSTRQCIIVDDCSEMIWDYPIMEWDELPRSAIVIPICSETSTDTPKAVLIVGLNIRRPFDSEYDDWFHGIRGHLTSALTSVLSFEAERERLDDIARMDRAKSMWFSGAAHDLRSPLTLIAGPIEDLLDTNLDPHQRQALSLANRNVQRLQRLVNALMDFSRLEAGRLAGRFAPVALGDFVADLANLFRPAVKRMGIEFNVEIESYDRIVYVDPVLFETIATNLIGNALKYTKAGTITVTLSFTDTEAALSVADTGVGIPQDELDQVADRFHRASTAINGGTEGTGLGLALAKELLRLHDGNLYIQSRTGADHGSTFTARVPLAEKDCSIDDGGVATLFGAYGKAVANDAFQWTRMSETDASSDGGVNSQIGSTGKSSDGLMFEPTDVILIVEDNRDMRQYIKRMFAKYCIVREAEDGEEALRMASESPPNLILSDVMMPKMDGFQLLAAVRANPATALIPTVLMSAQAGDEARVDALVLGAEDYISKPFRPKEMVARVHLQMLMGKKRAKLERLFEMQKAEIALLSDLCPTGIIRSDRYGNITYANAAWKRDAGMLPDDEPNDWANQVPEAELPRISAIWGEFLGDDSRDLKYQWKWKNGNIMSGLFTKLFHSVEGMTGTLGCLVDISGEEKRLVEAEERRVEAEESKHQQELLIDLTSHEIRTPVSAILQCSSLVKENLVALKEQLRLSGPAGFTPTPELLADLEEDVEALEMWPRPGTYRRGHLVARKDSAGHAEFTRDPDGSEKGSSKVFTSEAKMKKIGLYLEFGESLEAAKVSALKTDPVRLSQVVTNLINNAIRFTATAQTRRITIRYDVSFVPPAEDSCGLPSALGIPSELPAKEDTPLWLYVSVTDTGPGLGPKELAILFQRFSQITELLGGRIEVKSELGHGSTFRFFIQSTTVAPPPLAMLPDLSGSTSSLESLDMSTTSSVSSVTSASPSPSPGLIEEFKSLHILIVEDNIINQTVLKRQILKSGLTCDVANHGLEALNLIREAQRQAIRGGAGRRKPYDVVLMDLEMPVMDGLTAIREIRSAEAAGTLSRNMVIALTGNARQGQIDQALAAGMDEGGLSLVPQVGILTQGCVLVVIKPYVLSNLLRTIKLISTRRALESAGLEAVEFGGAPV